MLKCLQSVPKTSRPSEVGLAFLLGNLRVDADDAGPERIGSDTGYGAVLILNKAPCPVQGAVDFIPFGPNGDPQGSRGAVFCEVLPIHGPQDPGWGPGMEGTDTGEEFVLERTFGVSKRVGRCWFI